VSVKLVSKISNLCDPDPPKLQTDIRADDIHILQAQYSALHYNASRCKNHTHFTLAQQMYELLIVGVIFRHTYEEISVFLILLFVKKGKEDHTPTERWWGAHLPFYGRQPVGG